MESGIRSSRERIEAWDRQFTSPTLKVHIRASLDEMAAVLKRGGPNEDIDELKLSIDVKKEILSERGDI
jgi:hypothetical protein